VLVVGLSTVFWVLTQLSYPFHTVVPAGMYTLPAREGGEALAVWQLNFELTISADLSGSWNSSAPITVWVVPQSEVSTISTTGSAAQFVWWSGPGAVSGTISGQVDLGKYQSDNLAVVFGNGGGSPVSVTVGPAIGWASF